MEPGEVYAAIDAIVNGVKRSVEESWRAEQDTDVSLYHYTDQRGLLGILDTQVIFATDVGFVNDSEELRYVDGVLAALGSELEVHTALGRAVKVRLGAGELRTRSLGSAFVASFSEEPDLLSQWRAYAGDGSGYVVGFADHAHFFVAGDKERPPWRAPLMKVVYRPEEQRVLLGEPIRAVVALLEDYYALESPVDEEQAGWVRHAMGAVGLIAAHLAPAIKHPCFAEEREWRAVVRFHESMYPGHPLHFRPSRFGLAPYLHLTSGFTADGNPSLEVGEIIAGPKLGRDIAVRSVKYLLRQRGYQPARDEAPGPLRRGQPPRVRHSAATYR